MTEREGDWSARTDVPRLLIALGIEAKLESDSWWAACPYPGHEEKEPSWSIVEAGDKNGLNHCFGCGRGGDAVTLVMGRVDISFPSALDWMREHGLIGDAVGTPEVRVTMPDPTPPFVLPAGVIQTPLEDWPTPVRRYATSRGIAAAQVERWRIGYALAGRLRGRIVLPLRDYAGQRLLSYQARAWDGGQPRYLTPDAATEHPRPGAIFGEAYWPPLAARQEHEVVVTEGGINALACERAGARHVAALGGSSTDRLHVAKLATFGRVIVASDPDGAGEKVARSLFANYGRWREVARARIPVGHDPQSVGDAALEEILRGVDRT